MVAEMNDLQLLRVYTAEDSQDAFRTVVQRHVDLVYSTALRKTGNATLADEVTQAVFVLLARKAPSLDENTLLSGWLYRAACFAANDLLKAEARRRRRDQESYERMQVSSSEPMWTDIAPFLDDAVATLSENDRQAIILRFFENRGLREVGAALGVSDDTAQKRISRALGKLRNYFGRRKKVLTVGAIAALISANAVHAAPEVILDSITNTVIGKGVLATTTQELIESTANSLLLPQLRLAFWTAFSLLVIGFCSWMFFSQSDDAKLAVDSSSRIASISSSISSASETTKPQATSVLLNVTATPDTKSLAPPVKQTLKMTPATATSAPVRTPQLEKATNNLPAPLSKQTSTLLSSPPTPRGAPKPYVSPTRTTTVPLRVSLQSNNVPVVSGTMPTKGNDLSNPRNTSFTRNPRAGAGQTTIGFGNRQGNNSRRRDDDSRSVQ